jgi:hypothetical protein
MRVAVPAARPSMIDGGAWLHQAKRLRELALRLRQFGAAHPVGSALPVAGPATELAVGPQPELREYLDASDQMFELVASLQRRGLLRSERDYD